MRNAAQNTPTRRASTEIAVPLAVLLTEAPPIEAGDAQRPGVPACFWSRGSERSKRCSNGFVACKRREETLTVDIECISAHVEVVDGSAWTAGMQSSRITRS